MTAANQEPVTASPGSVDPTEVAKFSALAAEWWDPRGKFRPLHVLNPVRLAFLRDRLGRHFRRDPKSLRPFEGLSVLDIGCGGGLLSEPMAQLGAEVTGVDASERNIKIAALHARERGLDLTYRAGTAEALVTEGLHFDVVLNMEVVEHVAEMGAFIHNCGRLVRPGGLMAVATINRTPQAFALAIVAAERVLRWLPEGTHRYDKLVKPSELASALDHAGLDPLEWTGVQYHPLQDNWGLSANLSVNYMVLAERRVLIAD